MGKREEDRAFDIGPGESVPVGPGGEPTSFDATTLDFGHHAGRTIKELVTIDPDHLRWLARHPSGSHYRGEVERVLKEAVPRAGDWER